MTTVYILDFGNRIKIGRTKNIEQRIKAIENTAGEKVKEAFYIETESIKEKILHSYLQEFRTIGEYFSCSFNIAKTALENIVNAKGNSVTQNRPIRTRANARGHNDIVKSNDIIRHSQYDLSMQEQKIILYLMSKIQSSDDDFNIYEFTIADYCAFFEIKTKGSGAMYSSLKESVYSLYNKNVLIKLNNGNEIALNWIEKPLIKKNSGKISLKISDDLKPYLLNLKLPVTSYNLSSILAMKSQYSLRLYELLKSYEYQEKKMFDIEELKKLLSAENYAVFADFKRRVLDIALREINALSDMSVTYGLIKESHKFVRIEFTMKLKEDTKERLITWAKIDKVIAPDEVTWYEKIYDEKPDV